MANRPSVVSSDNWFDEMREQFARAEFTLAKGTYEQATRRAQAPTAARILMARILLKRDHNKAVEFLVQQAPTDTHGGERGLWAMYLGVGYSRMGEFQRADHHFSEAERSLPKRDIPLLQYYRARRFLYENRIDDAKRCHERMKPGSSIDARILSDLLNTFILNREERYADEARSLILLLELLSRDRENHLEEWFHAVQNLAVLARELPSRQVADVAQAEVDRQVRWTDDFLYQRFQALKAVAWTRALRGDMLGCFRYLRLAEPTAPNDAFRAILSIDRAHFAGIIEEKTWADDEISAAEQIANRVDWNAMKGEERFGLLLLAQAFADRDQEKARYYLARYKALDRSTSPLHRVADSPRAEALAAYAEGVVRFAAGEKEEAETLLRRAWVVFDRSGYDWRAGLAAQNLYVCTRRERWKHLAEDKFESYSDTWLEADFQHAIAPAGSAPPRLPPMQRRVFEMLCAKMTTAEMATSLKISPHTVRNHLKAVFKVYGVKNQSALIAEAARRGELPEMGRRRSR
ncbi:MAG TPA: helix-turn-helix transcriptional regulator [Candidatus Acidoferrales bacterium]|nr:helix-turn-helix transcriptional regulator [Candidatus Acidoferrales bacterium]